MLQRVVEAALSRKLLVVVFAGAIAAFGYTQLQLAQVESLPEFSPVVVEVQTEALGLSAEEVEQLITVPMEADLLNGVAWVADIHSRSIAGLSSIVMTFEPGTDLFEARQMVQERMTQAHALPNVSRPPVMVNPLASESRVLNVGLSSKEVSLIDLSVVARWTIVPRLLGVPGVANVSIYGQRERQLQVQANPDTLAAEDVSLQDIISTTGNALWVSPLSYLEASTPGAGGFVDTPNQRISVQHIPSISEAVDLEGVAMEGSTDAALGDVVKVVEDHQPLIGDAVVAGGNGLLLVIDRYPWATSREVTEGVEKAFAELSTGLAGVDVDLNVYRASDYVARAESNTQQVAIASAALLAITALLVLSNWRTALAAIGSVAVAAAAFFGILGYEEVTLNAMVIAGLVLALGVIVDDAIATAEAARRRLAAAGGSDERSVTQAVFGSLRDARTPLMYASVLAVVIAVPAYFLTGRLGAFLPPLATAYVLAIAVSALTAAVVTPVLSAVLLRGATATSEAGAGWHQSLANGVGGVLGRLAATPVPALAGLAALALVAAVSAPFVYAAFMPSLRQTDLMVRLEGAPGASLVATKRSAARMVNELRALPGVRGAGAHVGRAILSQDVVSANSASVWVNIDPEAPYDATVAAVDEVVSGYPGLGAPRATSYTSERISTLYREADDAIVMRVYGQVAEVVNPLADKMATMAQGVPGVTSAVPLRAPEEATIQIEVDLEKAGKVGLPPGDVRRAAATLISGLGAGSLFEEQKIFEVVVWSPLAARDSVSAVKKLRLDTPSGGSVALGDVADVKVVSYPSVIEHDAVSRYVDIRITTAEGARDSVRAALQERIKSTPMPFETFARLVAEGRSPFAAQMEALGAALVVSIVAFLLLQAAFDSWRLAFVLFVTAPFAMAGGLAGLALSGEALTIGAWVGFAAILGLTVRHGLLLMQRYSRLQLEEGMAIGPELIQRGASEQLIFTLASSLVLAAALIPFVVMGDIAGLEILRPLAIVVLGGLVVSPVVTLVVLPSLYLRLARPAVSAESSVAAG